MTEPLDPAAAAAVIFLAEAAAAEDGARPFSEQGMLRLLGEHSGVRHLLLHVPGESGEPELAAYAQLDASGAAEFAVHPAHRGQGNGTAVLTELVSAVRPGGLRVWSHSAHPAAAALAKRAGLVPVRELWQMGRDLPLGPDVDPPGPVPLPERVTVRTFVPGADEGMWLALNARAFAGHPEQGRLTRTDLDDRLAQPWFDPAGFFLAERSGGRLVGFHWTKVHPEKVGPRESAPARSTCSVSTPASRAAGSAGRSR